MVFTSFLRNDSEGKVLEHKIYHKIEEINVFYF